MTDSEQEQDEQEWLIATATEDDMDVLFRLLPQVPEEIDTADFPARIEIIWNYKSPNETGMPGPEDLDLMNLFEAALIDAWRDSGFGYLTMLITGNSICEWQWYVRDFDEGLEIFNEALEDLPTVPIDIHTEEDPKWFAYCNFMEQVLEEEPDSE